MNASLLHYLLIYVCKKMCLFVVSVSALPAKNQDHSKKEMHVAVIVLLTLLGTAILLLVTLVVYKYWQKRKREQDQARFLKLFEDGDDIEDELGFGTII